jgi:predicted nucleic-acid-binding protein
VRITADTNVLLRAAMVDDPAQSPVAAELLRSSELVAVTLPALCEFVWVLTRWYKLGSDRIAQSILALVQSGNVRADLPAIQAGLAHLEAGGDFADGVIAYEGSRLGGTVFATFDRAAAHILKDRGERTTLLNGAEVG